jgi:hypothetical protein
MNTESTDSFQRYELIKSCYASSKDLDFSPDVELARVFSEEFSNIVDAINDGELDEEAAPQMWESLLKDLLFHTFTAGYLMANELGIVNEEDDFTTLTFALDSDNISEIVKGLVEGQLNVRFKVDRT